MRIGTTLDVTRTAQELADVCVPALADFVSVDLLDPPEHGGEAADRARRAGRAAPRRPPVGAPGQPRGRGQARATWTSTRPTSPQADSLVAGRTVVATVATGAWTQWLAWDPARGQRVQEFGIHSTMSVPLRGPRHDPRRRRLHPATGGPTRSPQDDVLLAEEVTARAAVCIDNARRYSRERETALALQRSLLPRDPAAHGRRRGRLPLSAGRRRAGVGGDWFDVIPLSGMRVAMVVGDVVGHGIQASATMGRLRTAVRTLADIDLRPRRTAHPPRRPGRPAVREEAGGEGEPPARSAPPACTRCTTRCPGAAPWPGPGIRRPSCCTPDGTARQARPARRSAAGPGRAAVRVRRAGAARGQRARPLHRRSDRVPRAGRRRRSPAAVRGAGRPARSLDEICDRVLHALLPPGGAADDVALLLARTRGLRRLPGRHLGHPGRPRAGRAESARQVGRAAGRAGG